MSRVEKDMKNLKHCKCISCPSFTTTCKAKAVIPDVTKLVGGIDHAQHFEGMFCAFEKSSCIHEEHGCECKGCQVAKEHDLHHGYYCTHNVDEFMDDGR